MVRRAGENSSDLIVTSAHLASETTGGLSEFEFGINIAFNSFNRWIVQCMRAAGQMDLSALDTQVLHLVNHRDRAKRVSDLCIMLNIDDTHIVTYSLKKLQKLDLIESVKEGSEKTFKTTKPGADLCMEYRNVRSRVLIENLNSLSESDVDLRALAKILRTLSGFYDQAARSAATF
jgi:predicted MarR family transcription regulator